MGLRPRRETIASGALLLFLLGNSTGAAELQPLSRFSNQPNTLQIVSSCSPLKPWTVAGEYGALFGRQNGKFEAWQWPVKILSNFSIRAELAKYTVPIDVNALAAEIRVTPAETTITYSHAAFTIRQHMFAARGTDAPAASAIVLFEIQAIRPLELTFAFTPEMLRMWPASNFGRPNGEWIAQGGSGLYLLHTDNPHFSGIVAMPRARPGIMVPYQEHPQTYPLELRLSYDPKRDSGLVFPLIMALAAGDSPYAQASRINELIPELHKQTGAYYSHFFDTRVTADTPDKRLDEALQWAEIAVDQMQVRYHGETGLVAGYYESADSARPGYAWFFGRDTLWTTYAINSYGDFALTKKALNFLIRRQRTDGKIMHEFSQSADAVDWGATPYFYASADATPLLIMAVWDYVSASGDLDYLRETWNAVRKAYQFTRAHESDDGIYNNTQGTGWVESWPPGMPHQEIYLAALDEQSADSMSHLAQLMNDNVLSDAAHRKSIEIQSRIESEYYQPQDRFYAFSRNVDGSLDRTASIYPSVAWWDGAFGLQHAGPMLTRWASTEFSTDWGTRDISDRTSFYDPISYHQGSIWPLFTGWVSLAEYRAGRPLSGYMHLMQNAEQTWSQDLGSVTELLSGEFFQPLGRSSSHQMWSSAMVIAPLLRGLFGLNWDAPHRTLTIRPNLPPDWDRARLRNVPLGTSRVDLNFQRTRDNLSVQAETEKPETLCLTSGATAASPCKAQAAASRTIVLPTKPVEIEVPATLPEPGATTTQLKVLDEELLSRQAVFVLAAPAGSTLDLPVRTNQSRLSVKGAEMNAGKLHVQFPNGFGYQTRTVTFVW